MIIRGRGALVGFVVTCLMAACADQYGPTPGSAFAGVPSLVDDTVWRFRSGVTVPSRLRTEIEYIGRIDAEGGPYIVASGIECTGCDATRSVLLQPAVDSIGYLNDDFAGWYVYPGPIRSFEMDPVETIITSRLFWGACVAGRAPGMLQFISEREMPGAPQRDLVRFTEIRRGRLVDDSTTAPTPDTSDIAGAVRAGRCHEVPPREQWSAF